MVPSDSPDWDAPAPYGWWLVVYTPSVWSHARPAFDSDWVGVHCVGKVLAMQDGVCHRVRPPDDEVDQGSPEWTVPWLRLRDPCGPGEEWIIQGLGPGAVLEPLQTGCGPPPSDVRDAHYQAVGQVQSFRLKIQSEDLASAQRYHQEWDARNIGLGKRGAVSMDLEKTALAARRAADLFFQLGRPTAPHACDAAHELILRWGGDSEESSFLIRRLLRQGYVAISDALPGGAGAFVREMELLDRAGKLYQADEQTQGQRGDRILWVDELGAVMHHGSPAIASAVTVLKGVAHALNPALSRHHAECAAAGKSSHAGEPAFPATSASVLTVSPRAMAATYPPGASYILHTDNRYKKELKRRVNPRELTAILYANPPDWDVKRDGGALRIYPDSEGLIGGVQKLRKPVTVAPVGGRLVVFFSALWHEVMPATRPRRALTLWILRPDRP
uniref:Fe2OG dioxygenase domain-containing protein n=1 Tax=Alexandrium monilatum TaxID=311494 RepID=A0A7S4SSV7_9DINO|mmetsp:Transcript_71118/g.212053  ORF Transcript_71118/g.212053 Transcript_71118/m.212053 type:complete len:444 (+) Transcript_71118:44-1375(+)